MRDESHDNVSLFAKKNDSERQARVMCPILLPPGPECVLVLIRYTSHATNGRLMTDNRLYDAIGRKNTLSVDAAEKANRGMSSNFSSDPPESPRDDEAHSSRKRLATFSQDQPCIHHSVSERSTVHCVISHTVWQLPHQYGSYRRLRESITFSKSRASFHFLLLHIAMIAHENIPAHAGIPLSAGLINSCTFSHLFSRPSVLSREVFSRGEQHRGRRGSPNNTTIGEMLYR